MLSCDLFLAPDVAFNQSTTKCCIRLPDFGSSTSDLSPFGSMSSTFSSTWWCTVYSCDSWRNTLCLSHVSYRISQGAWDDSAEHKASKYLQSWYWTPTFKAYRIAFFMLLCALIRGLLTLWIIICNFCSILPWWNAQKSLCISFSQTCSIRLPPQLSRNLCTCSPCSLSPCIYLHLSEIRHHCHQL